MQTRRDFLKISLSSVLLADAATLFGAEIPSRTSWKAGITDWDLRATGRLSSFSIANELGFEGVQVSYQPDGEDSLADTINRSRFLAASKESSVAITSFCIGTLNSNPLATTPAAEGWVEDCMEAMTEMNVEQVLIPFFGKADMTQNTDHFSLVIEKFKRLSKIAERNKKILSIESTLSAEEHIKMIDAVGSNALKVYYDTANGVLYNKFYDIFHEMELLGKNNLISQVHFKENRQRLGDGNVNFTRICELLDKINYNGWIVVEGSTAGDWKESQTANIRFIKKLIEG
jgi:sugar phosphate isomerase/epimerase